MGILLTINDKKSIAHFTNNIGEVKCLSALEHAHSAELIRRRIINELLLLQKILKDFRFGGSMIMAYPTNPDLHITKRCQRQ